MGRWDRGRPLSYAEVEQLLLRSLDEMEAAGDAFEAAAVEAARAETEYRRRRARQIVSSQARTDAIRDATTTTVVAEYLEARNLAEARQSAASEVCRIRRASIEAVRTLAASHRAAETGRG